MKIRTILGKEIVEPERRIIAGVDCWLSEDGQYILAARLLEQANSRDPFGKVRRWRAEVN